MCKELYHLMSLEELLDTLHPDAKRAVQVQLKRYEEEIDYLNETITGLEEQLR